MEKSCINVKHTHSQNILNIRYANKISKCVNLLKDRELKKLPLYVSLFLPRQLNKIDKYKPDFEIIISY